MSGLKDKKGTAKSLEPMDIVFVGQHTVYSDFTNLQQQLNNLLPNIHLSFLQGSKLAYALANVKNNTYVVILTSTITNLSIFQRIEVSRNNCIFYIDTPNKLDKYTKVLDRWQLYKYLINKSSCKWQTKSKLQISQNSTISVKVLQSQTKQFNFIMSALSSKYKDNLQICIAFISDIKQLMSGTHQKRIFIVHEKQYQFAKHYINQMANIKDKVYTVLFDSNKVNQFKFCTPSYSQIERLLDSHLADPGKKSNLAVSRIIMKSVKKITPRLSNTQSRLIVVDSLNSKFKQFYKSIPSDYIVVPKIKDQYLFQKIIYLLDYNDSTNILLSLPNHENICLILFCDDILTPNQIFKHPSVRLITNNSSQVITEIKRQRSPLLQKNMNFNNAYPKNNISSKRSISSEKLLTKSRGTFPNGMKFMQWDTKLISPGIFSTYPEDEPENFKISNEKNQQNDYATFQTFGKLHGTGYFPLKSVQNYSSKNIISPSKGSLDFNNNQFQEPTPSIEKRHSILQKLVPIIVQDIQKIPELPLIVEKQQRSSGSCNQNMLGLNSYGIFEKTKSQTPMLPFESQLFTQTKQSKYQFSENSDHIYPDTIGGNGSNQSRLISLKERQSSIIQSKIAPPPAKQRFKSQNVAAINIGKMGRQSNSSQLGSFLTQNFSGASKIKQRSSKQLSIPQIDQVIEYDIKQQKAFQTDDLSFVRQMIKVSQYRPIKPQELQYHYFPSQNQSNIKVLQGQFSKTIDTKQSSQINQINNVIYSPVLISQQKVQILIKKSVNYLKLYLPQNQYNEYQFYTTTELKHLGLKINPDLKTILIVDEVPQCINYFYEYSYFDCIVIPIDKLYEQQKMKFPHFKWILQKDKEYISQIVQRHIIYQQSQLNIKNKIMTILCYYDQIQLQDKLVKQFGSKINILKYHSPQSLLSNIYLNNVFVILNLPFEWISDQIREKNPNANIITYSNGNKVFNRNGSYGSARKASQIIEWIHKMTI